jgi:2-iminobutanoate/2-iminopropanoate deaminase
VVQAAGATMADVVKATVHLSDIREFDRFNAAYREFFQSRGATILPARTTVQSGLYDGLKVEIDVIARVKE